LLPTSALVLLANTGTNDWWRVVISFAGPGRHLQLSSISKSLRDHHAATKFEPTTSLRIICETTSLCQWAREQGCPWDGTLCAAAATGGHLATLKWARGDVAACAAAASVAQGVHQHPSTVLGAGVNSTITASADIGESSSDRVCPWNARTTAAAAGGGHLEMLQWASNSGCPVNDTACWAAALGGHVAMLRWLHQQAPRYEWAGWGDAAVAAALSDIGNQDADLQRQHAISVIQYAVQAAPGAGGKSAAIVAVLRAALTDAELQDWGMRTMYDLAMDHPETVTELEAAGAWVAVVAGIRAHPANTDVQLSGMDVLAELAHGSSPIGVGVCEAVVSTMKAHVSHAGIQVSGVDAVAGLALAPGIAKAKLVEAGACEAVLAGMAEHTLDHQVQYAGAAAIAELAEASKFNTDLLLAAGATALLLTGMAAHINDSVVQSSSLGAIAELSCGTPDISAMFGLAIDNRVGSVTSQSAGVCEAVVLGMQAHVSNSDVQDNGACAIAQLASGRADVAAALGALGACEAVVAGMKTHASNASVQGNGASAVVALAQTNRIRLTEAVAREVVIAAMAEHTADEDVQNNGAQALESLQVA
jgi:hypothetical protein